MAAPPQDVQMASSSRKGCTTASRCTAALETMTSKSITKAVTGTVAARGSWETEAVAPCSVSNRRLRSRPRGNGAGETRTTLGRGTHLRACNMWSRAAAEEEELHKRWTGRSRTSSTRCVTRHCRLLSMPVSPGVVAQRGVGDNGMAAGTHIFVVGHGHGTYKHFSRNTFGANDHTVDFAEGGGPMRATRQAGEPGGT